MIENDISQPIQAAHMEAVQLFTQAVQEATRLGFTLSCSGGDIGVHNWMGYPVTNEVPGDSMFDAEYITNLLDWLEGVGFGRGNVLSHNTGKSNDV